MEEVPPPQRRPRYRRRRPNSHKQEDPHANGELLEEGKQPEGSIAQLGEAKPTTTRRPRHGQRPPKPLQGSDSVEAEAALEPQLKPRRSRPRKHVGRAQEADVVGLQQDDKGDAEQKKEDVSARAGRRRPRIRNNRRAQPSEGGEGEGDDQVTPTSNPLPTTAAAPRSRPRHRRSKRGDNDDNRSERSGNGRRSSRQPQNRRSDAGSNENKRQEGRGGKGGRPQTNRRRVFKEFMPEEEMQKRLAEGTLFKGILRINPKRRSHAYVTAENLRVDVFIDGDSNRNRALHGDIVCVELSPIDKWIPANKHALADHLQQKRDTLRDDNDDMLGSVGTALWKPRVTSAMFQTIGGDNTPSDLTEIEANCLKGNLQPSGKVVYIFEKSHSIDIIGALVLPEGVAAGPGPLDKSVGFVFFRPNDPKIPNCIANRTDLPFQFLQDPASMLQNIFKAKLKEQWSTTSRMPHAIDVHSIGEMGSIQAETDALLQQYDVDHGLFPDSVIQSLHEILPQLPEGADPAISHLDWQIPTEELETRRDLRDYRIFTIDPSTAKDLDDALHVKRISENVVEIGVHIADVSYFVRPFSELDIEAKRRATTIYLVQKVIPMLPPLLSEQLCSLNPNVDRLAYSAIWKMNLDGTLVGEPAWFGKTIIRSCAKLDYPTAQRMIEGSIPASAETDSVSETDWERSRRPNEHRAEDVVNDVLLMHKVAQARRNTRLENGALVLNRIKTVFRLDFDGNPTLAEPYPIKDSNKLVEEYMLLANYLVAEEMIVKLGKPAFLRRHPPPSSKGMEELKELAAALQLPIDTSSAASLQESLNRITREADPLVIQAVTSLLSRPMNNALYFVAGSKPSADWRHYALAIPYYTHFTSPIRRYADIIVHRMLTLGLIDSDQRHAPAMLTEYVGGSDGELELIANHCNTKKKAAKDAQERSDRIFLSVFVQRLPGGHLDEPAVVIGVGEKSFTVLLTRLGMESRIYLEDMPDLHSKFDANARTLTLTTAARARRETNDRAEEVDRLAQEIERLTIHDRASFAEFPLTIFTPVVVRLYTRTTPPIDIKVTLLSP